MLRINIMAGFDPADVQRAAKVLCDGGIGIVPTDTVYGIAALARDANAVSRVLDMKRRGPDKPLPVQVASMRQADELAVMESRARALAARYWPGALTLVVPRKKGGPHLAFQEQGNIGLRIPDDLFCISLIEHAGYLVLPSANLPGENAPDCLSAVRSDLLEAVDFVVNGGVCTLGSESSVVEVIDGVKVLRAGAIPTDEIKRVALAHDEGAVDA